MRRPRYRWWILGLILIGVAGLIAWFAARAGFKVARLKIKLEAQGERFTLEALELHVINVEDPTLSVLQRASSHLGELTEAQVDATSSREHEPARARPPQVAWQQPFLYSPRGEVLEWDLAAEVADRVSSELQPLHDLMRSLSPGSRGELHLLDNGRLPNYLPLRETAQGLQQLVTLELHRGRTDQAFTNLLTLVRFCRYHQTEANLVAQMLRMAVFAMAADALWQALQAPGWTEAQLRTLQQELTRVDLLSPLARTYEFERIGALRALNDYRDKGISHLRVIYQGFGASPPGWRQQLHRGYWRLGRDDAVEYDLIRGWQRIIERARLLAGGHAVDSLPAELAKESRSRFQRWFDDWAAPPKGVPPVFSYTQAATHGGTLMMVAHREAQRRLALVALALERFRLKTGVLPETLTELLPAYLETVPLDPFDEQPMRYEPALRSAFTLSFRGPDGEVRRRSTERLLWPSAEPTLPLPEPAAVVPYSPSNETLPLVAFDQAPLIDVIKTLARQAKINMIIDPRVVQQEHPPINLHMDQVTAFEVLQRVLRANRLRLEEHPKSHIYRIVI